MKNKKSIVVYFSHKGNNYVNGNIINLKKGNTEVVAEKIQNLTDSDIFEIETMRSYPIDYNETTEEAKRELNINARPELKKILDISEYETIYLGYPNWWNTMPMSVFTFLENSKLEGKRIVPFCTHEGSGLGRSIKDIEELCPDSKILKGIALYGSRVKEADEEIRMWLEKL